MKLIAEIDDKDVFENNKKLNLNTKFRIRETVRVFIFKDEKIALNEFTNLNHHITVGGGIEEGESHFDTINREVLEEVGCKVEVLEEFGKIITKRYENKLQTIGYCYIAKFDKKICEPKFSEKERRYGTKLKWVTIDEALNLFKSDTPKTYDGHFEVKSGIILIEELEKIK